MKTNELIGTALDYAVAMAGKFPHAWFWNKDHGSWMCLIPEGNVFSPSTMWEQGGPIIEQEMICIDPGDGLFEEKKRWSAWLASNAPVMADEEIVGPTALIAAMRCYVASKLGEEVEIPEALLK